MKDKIAENLNNPEELERLYRLDGRSFAQAFRRLGPESAGPSYDFWMTRIRFDEDGRLSTCAKADPEPHLPVQMVVLLALIAGTIAKTPDLFGIDENFFYPRFIAFALFPVLSAYFLLRIQAEKRILGLVSGVFLISVVYMRFLPGTKGSQTVLLSCIHLPFFLWTVTGLSFVAGRFKEIDRRIDYIKYNGELAVYTAVLLISGMILTGVTAGLFSVIRVDIMGSYRRWVVVYGAAACPIVGCQLAALRSKGNTRISPVIARIFAPLFLFTLIAYLLVIVLQRKSPYTDRDFLIVFNIMLLLVLAIGIFSITEKEIEKGQKWLDAVIMALLVFGLLVDLIALSAILFRLGSYGFTPNRIAVLGANLLVCGNAAGLVCFHGQQLRGKRDLQDVKRWIGRYLPVYSLWTAFIVFVFPLLYVFK
jgi:hypothetical protein